MIYRSMCRMTLHVGTQRLTLASAGHPPQIIAYATAQPTLQKISPTAIVHLILSPLTYLNTAGKETIFLSDAQQTFLHQLAERSFFLQGLSLYSPLEPSAQDWTSHIYEYWDETRTVWVVGPKFSGLRELSHAHLEQSLKQFQNYLRRYGYRAASSDAPSPQRKITPAEMLEQPQTSRRLTPLTIPNFLAPQARLFRQWSILAHSLMLGMILTLKALGWYGGLYYQQQHIAQQETTQHSENQEQAVAQARKALDTFMSGRVPPDFSILRQFISDFYGDGIIQSLDVQPQHITAIIVLNPDSDLNAEDMIAWATLYPHVVIEPMEDTDTSLKLRIEREKHG